MTQNQPPSPLIGKQSNTSIVVVLRKPRCSPLKWQNSRNQLYPCTNEVTVLGSSRDSFFLSLIYNFLFFFFFTKVGIVWNMQCCHLLYFI